MPNPFIENFFVSDSYARRIYERIRGTFKGGTWKPTPLDDPTLSKKGFSKWWRDEYDNLRKALGEQKDVLHDVSNSVVEKLELLDKAIKGKETEIPVGEIGVALVNSLNRVQALMGDLATKVPKAAGSIEAFKDACYSAGMSAAALVENAQRAENKKESGQKPESLRETFEQIVVRDVVASLHELVGDPPRAFLLSPTTGGEEYLGPACVQIDIPAIYGERVETPDFRLMKLITDAKSADAILKRPTVTDAEQRESEAMRSKALTGLADTLRDVSKRTKELVLEKSSRAGPAVEFAMVAVEATRDVLGMEHRGTRPFGRWDVKERKKAGRERAEETRKREEPREKERR